MNPSLWVTIALGMLLAYANGSNDVSKGIATLAGSGVTNYRRAILWGTAWTGLGGFAGALLAGAMVGTFGKGAAGRIVPTLAAAIATILGAAAWVAFATSAGLPVSTTHAIVGINRGCRNHGLWIFGSELGGRGREDCIAATAKSHSRAHSYNSCAPRLEVFRHAEREHW